MIILSYELHQQSNDRFLSHTSWLSFEDGQMIGLVGAADFFLVVGLFFAGDGTGGR